MINQLINKKIILEQEKEIYCFGICQLIMLLLNICTSFFISLCYGRIIEGMIFSSAYILLRSYAGGYHAKTRKRCYILSSLMAVIVFPIIELSKNRIIICGEIIMSAVMILILAPVDVKNKRLENIEKQMYRKKCIYIFFFEILCCICFALLRKIQYASCISVACTITAFMLVIGKVK